MKEEGDRVFLTQDGTLVSNQVLCEFLFDKEVLRIQVYQRSINFF